MIQLGSAAAEQAWLAQLLNQEVTAAESFFWKYPKPAVITGRGQKPGEDVYVRARKHGIEITGRLAGGGAVIAGPWMLSVSTLVPPDHTLAKMSLPRAFTLVGEAWNKALQPMGLETELIRSENLKQKQRMFKNNGLEWSCFSSLSHGELTDVENRKLVGLAQIRKKTAIAVVSGILLKRPDWETLTAIWLGECHHEICKQLDVLTVSLEQLLGVGQKQLEMELVSQMANQLKRLDLHS